MKKNNNKIINLIFVLIIGDLLIFMLAKQTYHLADGLERGTPEYDKAMGIIYFWFDFSTYLGYVLYNTIISAILFLVNIPIYIRALMLIYLGISIKGAVMFPINENKGTFIWDIVILLIGILWLLKKTTIDWNIKSCKIRDYDKEAIYRITNHSKTIYGTILSMVGDDVESVKYYAYDSIYKFSRLTDRFVVIECEPESVMGNIQRIPCESQVFAQYLNEKLNSKYHILFNNCETVANQAKLKVGLKSNFFPQIN